MFRSSELVFVYKPRSAGEDCVCVSSDSVVVEAVLGLGLDNLIMCLS